MELIGLKASTDALKLTAPLFELLLLSLFKILCAGQTTINQPIISVPHMQ
jgi:hypothetical protein